MDVFSAALLGLIQALTEFLPVSSSGHLVLGKAVLGVEMGGGAAFEVAVHFGTLLSVLTLFRADVVRLLAALPRVLKTPRAALDGEDPELRFILAIVIGCIPAGVVGVLFKDELEAAFDSPKLVCGALIVTGVWLLSIRLAKESSGDLSPMRALLIGAAQAIAIIPGISRSGSTISTAVLLGVERELAARFSFLMSVPVIAGATVLKARDLAEAPPAADMLTALAVGAVVSFVVGVAALWLLMHLVRRGRFADFAWYCFAVGGAGLVLL